MFKYIIKYNIHLKTQCDRSVRTTVLYLCVSLIEQAWDGVTWISITS